MRSVMLKISVARGAAAGAGALLLLAGCSATPPPISRAVYYLPPVRAPSYAAQAAAVAIDSAPSVRNPVPINAPLPGVPAGDDCGWWRLCNLPGWRYEN